MARNSTGTYSLPNTAFTPQTSIVATTVNGNFSDIAAALTTSLATTGVSTMTGPIQAANGSTTNPGYTFNTANTTGWYLSATNELTFCANATNIAKWNSTGLNMLNATITDKNGNLVAGLPVGIIFPYSGGSVPQYWLLCYGQNVSRTTYANLFATLSTTFGSGDGVTTFGLPDLRGRLPFGKDNMGGSAANRITNAGSGIVGTTLGASGGLQNTTLAQANMPNIASLTVTDPKHLHTSNQTAMNAGSLIQTGGSGTDNTQGIAINNASTNVTVQWGSGTAKAIVNPALILNYMIYAGV